MLPWRYLLSNQLSMHWFLDPIKDHYADFEGRATRQQFWMFTLIYVLLFIALEVMAQAFPPFAPISIVVMLGLLLPSLALGARRLHDHGKSGWWQLIGIIPFIGLIAFIILMALPGDEGENRFGPNPKGGGTGLGSAVEPSETVMPTEQSVETQSEIPPNRPMA